MAKFTLTFPDDTPAINVSMSLEELDTIVRQPILTSMDSGHLNREEAIDAAAAMLRHSREDAEAYLFNRDDELSDYFNGFY